MSIPAGSPQRDAAKKTGTRSFAARLIRWHRRCGRHDLPWQNTADPYRVWLSEIMLQQTQVATVIPYYRRFLARFPDLGALAAAPLEDVMALWSGLGYYARARNLHACARTLADTHRGGFPRDPDAIARLPGIGRSTANSIATFCFGAQAPILDGNARRVLCRHFGIEGHPGVAAVERRLWELAHDLMPRRHGATYNQAQMDLGATVCTRGRPHCDACPLADDCVAHATGRTAELPAARPRKDVPRREATLLAVHDGRRVLLETRPPAGIWGGLRSLPELPADTDPGHWVARAFACRVVAVAPAPTVDHAFSHFRLRIAPLLVEVEPRDAAMEPGLDWWPLDALDQAGLPAPVRRILDGLQASGSRPLLSRKR